MAHQARRDREERRDRCACREFYPAADQFLDGEIIRSTEAEVARRDLVIPAKTGIHRCNGSRLSAGTTENCRSVLWRRLSAKQLLKPGPARVVIALQGTRLEREAGRADHEARLEHEGERVLDLLRCQFSRNRLIESGTVGAMSGHAIVQRGAAGVET